MTPSTDSTPPKLLSSEYENPVSLSSIINTAGAEDSPFILPDGKTLYFFFTPDVSIPAEKQLLDEVTGIYVSKNENGQWQTPTRVLLQTPGKLALDGCEFVSGNIMLFCSAREGYEGINWFSAEFENGKWITTNKKIEFPEDYKVGELHEYDNEIYYHSDRVSGKGGLDIWKIKRNFDHSWSTPENVQEVNSVGDEGWPAISPDGNELWFSKDYGIWRSKKINNVWQTPELIISNLAGEPSLDNQGNLYFVHHYFKDNKMIEADIYIAYKK
jgi:Tol biopolymer transport system component